MDQATVNANVAQAQQQGQARQQALDTQSSQLQGQYGQAQQQASQAVSGIQNAGDLYGQNLQNNLNYMGIKQGDIANATRNMVTAQNQIANAPLAAQQAGNYYGTTSGGTTNIYGNLMSNLNPALTNATNSAGALSNLYGQAQTGANQQAGLTAQSQQVKAQQAVAQMSAAGSTMTAIEGLAQQQGYLTAQQSAAYQNAYNQYLSAKAAQASAAAAQTSANASMMTAQQQVSQYQNLMNGMKSLYGDQWQQAIAQLQAGQPISVTPKSSAGGLNMNAAVSTGGLKLL